nr:MAG TPA: hypothetical protein [Caudoviricetes sp.]
MSKTSSAVKDRYNAKAYDRITLRTPKGEKEKIEEKSRRMGYPSVNSFILAAVEKFGE